MAPHHRSSDRPPQESRSVPEATVREDQSVAPTDGTTASDGAPIAAAIEREELRARIRALERELVASERQRLNLIEQYERLLAERDATVDATDGGGTDRSVLGGLLVGR